MKKSLLATTSIYNSFDDDADLNEDLDDFIEEDLDWDEEDLPIDDDLEDEDFDEDEDFEGVDFDEDDLDALLDDEDDLDPLLEDEDFDEDDF